jgi:hypothetical protein
LKRLGIALLFLAMAWSAYKSWLHRQYEQTPGTLVAEEPEQDGLGRSAPEFSRGGYAIKAVASYRVHARLLGRESYSHGRESDLSPLDSALGWGPMSDSAVLAQMQLSQSARFFMLHWPTKEPPLPSDVIFDHAANTHLIPADSTVLGALDRMRPGQVIELQGYLVNVSASDGWQWHSSLTRSDRGAGACELMWVESAQVN